MQASQKRTENGKPAMWFKWADELSARPIKRDDAAQIIRKNRRQPAKLRVSVYRKSGETHIASSVLGVGCVIFRTA